MKKQVLLLLAVLLTSTTAIALAMVAGLQANTVHLSVTVVPEGAGSVERPERDIVIGGKATFTATSNPGYGFDGWYVNDALVSTANPYQFTNLQEDMNIVAKFNALEASTLIIGVKAGCEEMGTVGVSPVGTPVEGGYKYTTGTTVTAKATPNKGHQFERWEDAEGNVLSDKESFSFAVDDNMSVYAVFSKLPNYNPDLIAFPGVEGYGRFTTGGRMIDGRGSKVYYVTRLDDSNVEGTFRWAATTGDDTPRTILFKVSGTIYLTSRFSVKPNTTIAGQTAPGGGICIAGYQLKLGSNSIVRHIRFRAGDLYKNSMSCLDVENVNNIVLDHCTFSWSMEENLTMYDCDYTTVQWCIFSEGLYDSRNNKGARAYACQWGGEHGTLHHCLFANCNNRSPRFNGVRASTSDRHVDSEFVNNVIYNWGKPNNIYGGEKDQSVEGYNRTYMINNYFRPGPTTQANTSGSRYFVGASSSNGVGQWLLQGNKFELSSKWAPSSNIWKDDVLQKVNADNLHGFISNSGERAVNLESVGQSQATYEKYILQTPVEWSGMTYESADEAYQKVVTRAGASLPRYDEVDARVLAEAAGTIDPQFAGHTEGGSLSRGMGIINSPKDITLSDHDVFAALYEGDDAKDNAEVDVTMYPRLQRDDFDAQVVDTDGDGLPDAYEVEKGLNPNNPADGAALTESGYSNLELFLNGVADGQIDAKKYTKHQVETVFTGFDAVVGEGEQYATVQAAVDAAPAGDAPYYIFIKKGEYHEHVAITRSNVHLVGQDRSNTIIWDNKANDDDGGVDKAATINVTGSDVSFDNLTIRNPRTDKQAVAIYTNGDRNCITSCNLEGYQDTYRTANKDRYRNLVRSSKISGRTDFIYGTGEVFFDNCELNIVASGGWIVAPAQEGAAKYGYVFRNAVITAKEPGLTTYLGRPWKEKPIVSFINTRLAESVSIYEAGWSDMGGLPVQMAEYNTVDANGNAVDLSKRKTSFSASGSSCTSKAIIGKVEADSYQLDYMLRGTDSWDADWQAFILPAPAVYVNETTVSWKDLTGYASLYLVTVDGVATITSDTSRANDGKTVLVRAFSNYGVLSEQGSSENPTGIKAVTNSQKPVAKRHFFTVDGRQHQRLQHGMNVIRETYADGTSQTIKIMAK